MALGPGISFGPYEVLARVGVGGMGEVYRARDTKLNRDVALKVLPEAFALDPERLARFRREAQVLASLNHTNIATIHGFEESDGVQALVLEYVDGPTLADRITSGRIPVDEALSIARQIADALKAAHEQGIVHRDLKPANIKLRPDDAVKVLDFGLAKMLEGQAEAGHYVRGESSPVDRSVRLQPDLTPTITSPAMTQMGVILGTAAYMSPEQAKGRAADTRSDVWAFGCVVYEMLTGARAFEGEDVKRHAGRRPSRRSELGNLARRRAAFDRHAAQTLSREGPHAADRGRRRRTVHPRGARWSRRSSGRGRRGAHRAIANTPLARRRGRGSNRGPQCRARLVAETGSGAGGAHSIQHQTRG